MKSEVLPVSNHECLEVSAEIAREQMKDDGHGAKHRVTCGGALAKN